MYAYRSIDSLQKIYPEAEEYVKQLYLAVKGNFEGITADTYPLLYGMYAAVIVKNEGAILLCKDGC